QQNLSFGRGGMHDLSDQRTNRAASLNDRPFRAEWASSADGDGSRNGLKNRYTRLNLAAIGQHGFHGLGNAVALDLRAPVLCHDPDDDAADDGDNDHPESEVSEAVARAREVEGKMPVESNVGEQPDELVKQEGYATSNQAYPGGQERDGYHAEPSAFGRGTFRGIDPSDG